MNDFQGEVPGAAVARHCLCGAVLLGLMLAGTRLRGDDSVRWGLQAGVLWPASQELKLTTGSGLGGSLGARVEWHSEDWGSREQQTLRLRLDLERYQEGKQVSETPDLHQEITTKVRNESLGLEQLFYVDRWSFGAGIYAIHWTVDSTNLLKTPAGEFAPSGSSSWTRMGLSLIGGRRLMKHAEVELRYLVSHYGQENQLTGVASLNLVWTF